MHALPIRRCVKYPAVHRDLLRDHSFAGPPAASARMGACTMRFDRHALEYLLHAVGHWSVESHEKQMGRFTHLAKNWKELCPMATTSGANEDGVFRIGGNVVDLSVYVVSI